MTTIEHLLQTDRGGISQVRRGAGWRIHRYIDSSLADMQFGDHVEELASAIAKARPPRVLPIVEHGRAGDFYCVEYDSPWPAESLPSCFARTHWLDRLALASQLLAVYPKVRECVNSPIGLHAGRVLACQAGTGWEAHLALCPPLRLAAPDVLSHADSWVLAGIPPEELRGVGGRRMEEDLFGMGALVLLALGVRPPAGLSGCEAVEAQARAAFLPLTVEHSSVEPLLRRIALTGKRISTLEKLALRCVHFAPAARPSSMGELTSAFDGVLEIRLDSFAARIEAEDRASDALRFLEWRIDCGHDSLAARRMAAGLCETLGLTSRELKHLEKLLDLGWDATLARRRWKLRYESYLATAPWDNGRKDDEGDWLLRELDRLSFATPEDDDSDETERAKEDRLRAAMIHGHRGDIYRRCEELHAMVHLDFRDIEALFLYALCCREAAGKAATPEANAKGKQTMQDILSVTKDRLSKLQVAGLIDEGAVRSWIERFQSLLLH